jgi:hypothetical protein
LIIQCIPVHHHNEKDKIKWGGEGAFGGPRAKQRV